MIIYFYFYAEHVLPKKKKNTLAKYLKNVLFIGALNFSNYLQTSLTYREKQEHLTAEYFTKSKPKCLRGFH